MRLLISAGEASGDMHGAALMAALRNVAAPEELECFGLGGERMRAAGCETVVDAKDVAVVGLVEIVAHLPRIYREFHRLLGAIDRRPPDIAVLIDFPDFNFRLARELHRRRIPVVYYISPQLWAWRKRRLRLVRKYVRKMLVIFPFEREFYLRHGVEAEFVGHPLAEDGAESDRPEFRDAARIALLPGSRRKEIELNLPAMMQAAALLHKRHPELHFVLPVASTISRPWLEQLLAGTIREQSGSPITVRLVEDARAALAGSRAAVVASGTATLQAALSGTPFVMVYRVAKLSWLLGRKLVNVPFFCIVNLIAGQEIVPELVQRDFSAEQVAERIERLLPDGPERHTMIRRLQEVRAELRAPAETLPARMPDRCQPVAAPASERAARQVLELWQNERRHAATPACRG